MTNIINMADSEISLWQKRLIALSNSGACDGFLVTACGSEKGGGTVTAHCRTARQMLALAELLKSRRGGCDCTVLHSEEDGGEQWQVKIFVPPCA